MDHSDFAVHVRWAEIHATLKKEKDNNKYENSVMKKIFHSKGRKGEKEGRIRENIYIGPI